MAQIQINTRTHTKEKPYLINSYLFKIGKAKKVNRVSKIRVCIYVSEICAEGIFVTFPWWLKNVKSRSKIALFSNEHHFEIWFPKKRTITFSWSKLSKLHKKDPILHVATTFSLKQGERRTSHGPIPHPLSLHDILAWNILITWYIWPFISLAQGYSTLFHGGPKEVQKYMLKGQINITFWAFPICSCVREVIKGPNNTGWWAGFDLWPAYWVPLDLNKHKLVTKGNDWKHQKFTAFL